LIVCNMCLLALYTAMKSRDASALSQAEKNQNEMKRDLSWVHMYSVTLS
jgi:hypothetical protein